MDPIGYEGIFKQAMINSFEALQKKSNLIVDYCDVFIDDPLMEWVWNSKKQLSSFVPENTTFSISQ
jgi:phosphatidylinositol kinase/protein kinase (PI-3  family)